MHQRNRGMTLIELMVVVVIVGILAAIAVPSYRNYVLRAHRVEAKNALLSTAAAYERCFTRFNTYLNPCAVVLDFEVGEGTATYRIEAGENGIEDVRFDLRAVPVNAQAADTKCGTFQLDNANERKVTGTHSATPQECWGK